jgi:hypothetical protein
MYLAGMAEGMAGALDVREGGRVLLVLKRPLRLTLQLRLGL